MMLADCIEDECNWSVNVVYTTRELREKKLEYSELEGESQISPTQQINSDTMVCDTSKAVEWGMLFAEK